MEVNTYSGYQPHPRPTIDIEDAIDAMVEAAMLPTDLDHDDVADVGAPDWVRKLEPGGFTILADDGILYAVAFDHSIRVVYFDRFGVVEGKVEFTGERALQMFRAFLGS